MEDAPSRREVLAGAGALGLLTLVDGCDSGAPLDEAVPQQTPVTANADHYVTSCCGTPTVDAATWTLSILDADANVLGTLDAATLATLTPQDKTHTLECISADPGVQKISNAVWSGLPLPELLDQLGITVPDGTVAVRFDAADGYSDAVPVADLASPMWLVWKMNGDPLPPLHGFPARVLTPGRYGMKNPKWVVSMTFLKEDYVGFWERFGWSQEATYKPNTFITWPLDEGRVRRGTVRAFGTAYAGRDPVVKVEVRIDDGPWQEATLDLPGDVDQWALWSLDVDLKHGTRRLQARCTTAGGAVSAEAYGTAKDLSGYGGSMKIALTAV